MIWRNVCESRRGYGHPAGETRQPSRLCLSRGLRNRFFATPSTITRPVRFSADRSGVGDGRMCAGDRSSDSPCVGKTQVVGCKVHLVGLRQQGPKRPAGQAADGKLVQKESMWVSNVSHQTAQKVTHVGREEL